jgi:hypothetical protein
MRHDEFAERAGRGITAMRANELRVAAHVVRDLSEAVTREERRASIKRLPL